MSQMILELRQPTPLEILVENVPVKEGNNILKTLKPSTEHISSKLRWDDIIGLSWVFKDPLEEDWSF